MDETRTNSANLVFVQRTQLCNYKYILYKVHSVVNLAFKCRSNLQRKPPRGFFDTSSLLTSHSTVGSIALFVDFDDVPSIHLCILAFDNRTKSAREFLRQMMATRYYDANPKLRLNTIVSGSEAAPEVVVTFVDDSEVSTPTLNSKPSCFGSILTRTTRAETI